MCVFALIIIIFEAFLDKKKCKQEEHLYEGEYLCKKKDLFLAV